MKHRVLLEFSADTLPDDFLDQIAGRVYGHPAVDKKECTATLLGPEESQAQVEKNLEAYKAEYKKGKESGLFFTR